jgi:hypothetical protein
MPFACEILLAQERSKGHTTHALSATDATSMISAYFSNL